MASSFAASKKSFTAYKGHYNRTTKAFEALLQVKPRPTIQTLEKSYTRVQKQMDALFNSADSIITLLESFDSAATDGRLDINRELIEMTQYYEKSLTEQCDIESKYVEFKESCTASSHPTTHMSQSTSRSIESNRPSVRLTALEPPSWNGTKADFYTWQRKFIHIMEEARINDELTQLCYLQNSKILPTEYQMLISDCSTISEVWSRLEERVPKETIKCEIISQFRNLKPLSNKKTPTILRNFANEISLFCRRMADLGIQKDNYSCIILQDKISQQIAVKTRNSVIRTTEWRPG